MGATARDLKEYTLQKLVISKSSKSGANIQEWQDVDTILVAVYKRRTTVTVEKLRKVVITYNGLTKYKNLVGEFNRLVAKDGTIFDITDVTPNLWTNLELSIVEID